MIQKNIFILLSILFIGWGCASTQQKAAPKNDLPFHDNIIGPKGTDVSNIYDSHASKTGFRAEIARNLGLSRTESESAQRCYRLKNGDNITWDFKKLRGANDFRTPIDLITLSDGKALIFKQRIQDNVTWNEYPLNDVIIPIDLYLDRQNAHYALALRDNMIALTINHKNYGFMATDYKNLELCLGLKRLELLRWTGQVVPSQALDVIIGVQ